MFDRCDADTRGIVDAALGEARRRGHDYVGTEHMLLVLAQRRELLPPEVAVLLPDAAAVASALDAALGRPARPDAELLKVVGVDLEEVRSAVRQTFGDAAIQDLGRRRIHQPWQPWRRPTRRCTSIIAESLGIAPRLKLAMERASEYADIRQRLASIDSATLLLGMVEVEDAMSNRILRDLGVDLDQLARTLRNATR